MSLLAGTFQLPKVEFVTPDGEVLSNEREFADALTEEQGLEFIQQLARSLCDKIATDYSTTLVTHFTVRDAVLRIVARNNAVWGRYNSSDDTSK